MTESEKKDPNDVLWRQLGNVISLRTSEDQLLWAGFGIFWGANAVLFIPWFTIDITKNHLALVIPIIGIIMSVLWGLIQRRTLMHIKMHEGMMKEIQNKLRLEDEFVIYGERITEKYLAKGPRVRNVIHLPLILFIAVWSILLTNVIFLIVLSHAIF